MCNSFACSNRAPNGCLGSSNGQIGSSPWSLHHTGRPKPVKRTKASLFTHTLSEIPALICVILDTNIAGKTSSTGLDRFFDGF